MGDPHAFVLMGDRAEWDSSALMVSMSIKPWGGHVS